jgi:hypothetical protein
MKRTISPLPELAGARPAVRPANTKPLAFGARHD